MGDTKHSTRKKFGYSDYLIKKIKGEKPKSTRNGNIRENTLKNNPKPYYTIEDGVVTIRPIAPYWASLRPRQKQIVILTADGFNQKDIAKFLGLSVETVKRYTIQIKRLFNLPDSRVFWKLLPLERRFMRGGFQHPDFPSFTSEQMLVKSHQPHGKLRKKYAYVEDDDRYDFEQYDNYFGNLLTDEKEVEALKRIKEWDETPLESSKDKVSIEDIIRRYKK